jgi:hypothetical protein
VPIRRKTPVQREAAKLADAHEQRQSDLAEREAALHATEEQAAEATAAANLARGLDEITETEHAERITAADARVADARAARDSARSVLEAVATAAADAADAVATATVGAAAEDLERADSAVEETAALLGQRQLEREAAAERLALAQRRALDARAAFDTVAAADAERRAKKDASWALWYVRSASPGTEIPAERREAVEAAQAALDAENDAYVKRLRAHPDRVETGADGLRERDAFDVVEPIGPSRG